jgi:hypothetical protein
MANNGHHSEHGSLRDPDALRVLSTIYRARPPTRGELAAFESMPHDRLDDVLSALAADGLIALDGDRIQPRSPDRVVATLSETVLEQEREKLAGLIELTATLSGLSRDWELGIAADGASTWAEIIHGHEAQWRAWGRYATTHPPVRPINLYPDLTILGSVILPGLSNADRAAIDAATAVRGVLPASVLATAEDRRTLDQLVGIGMRLRIVESVPSWIYSDSGVLCALPLSWAEHPPSSIVIVQQPAIVEAVSLLVESFWDRGADYPSRDQAWRAILELLGRGMPDATIADSLDLSLRTVQRRITEAMDHYGVRSRFELGAAWAKEHALQG